MLNFVSLKEKVPRGLFTKQELWHSGFRLPLFLPLHLQLQGRCQFTQLKSFSCLEKVVFFQVHESRPRECPACIQPWLSCGLGPLQTLTDLLLPTPIFFHCLSGLSWFFQWEFFSLMEHLIESFSWAGAKEDHSYKYHKKIEFPYRGQHSCYFSVGLKKFMYLPMLLPKLDFKLQ